MRNLVYPLIGTIRRALVSISVDHGEGAENPEVRDSEAFAGGAENTVRTLGRTPITLYGQKENAG
jgi:hypothetical protein